MKLAFRLGFILIPFLFLLSQNAYPRGLDLSPTPAITVTFGHASRAPASLSRNGHQMDQRAARLGECTGLSDLRIQPLEIRPANLAFLSENARPAQPYEGSGIGVQSAVFHFDE